MGKLSFDLIFRLNFIKFFIINFIVCFTFKMGPMCSPKKENLHRESVISSTMHR